MVVPYNIISEYISNTEVVWYADIHLLMLKKQSPTTLFAYAPSLNPTAYDKVDY